MENVHEKKQILIFFYLQEQNELWKSLNGLHHEPVQSDPVNAGGLLLLEAKTNRKNKQDEQHVLKKTIKKD